MLAIIGQLFGAIAAPLLKAIGQAVAIWSAYRTGKREGVLQEDLRQAQVGQATQKRMNDADSRGPRTGGDAADRMSSGTF